MKKVRVEQEKGGECKAESVERREESTEQKGESLFLRERKA